MFGKTCIGFSNHKKEDYPKFLRELTCLFTQLLLQSFFRFGKKESKNAKCLNINSCKILCSVHKSEIKV